MISFSGTEKNDRRLFVDMDGTLAEFRQINKLETLYEKGYFENLKPMDNVIGAVKEILREHPEIEVHILSAHLSDSPYALAEKNAWLDRHLPEIPAEHRIFPPCGTNKTAAIPGGLKTTDFLLDDYTQNLTLWQPPARGIKLLNGINHTKETWQHDRLRYDKTARELAENIAEIITGGAQFKDPRPPARAPEPADRLSQTLEPVPEPAPELTGDPIKDFCNKFVEKNGHPASKQSPKDIEK